MTMVILMQILLFCCLCSIPTCYAKQIEALSFSPPFTEIDSVGARMVRNWKVSGSTIVSNNFIRLTPDRQSKKGALWSRKPLGVDSFSTILKFRISGQAKTFFGDGIAIWITHHSYHVEGNLHGSDEKFLGIGVIFDTFKNTESLSSHRDVTILVNDGEKTWEMMTEDVQGCNMNVRYHNERADFSALDASRAQFVVGENSLKVMVDAKNNGEWSECVTLDKLGLPVGWVKDAYIGITASTGQLADNHDVIALETDSEHTQDTTTHISIVTSAQQLAFDSQLTPGDMDLKIIADVNRLSKSVEELNIHVEHEFASIREKINNIVSKLEKREDSSEKRIEMLESVVKTEVEGTLTTRLEQLEKQIKGTFDTKFNTIHRQIDMKIGNIETVAKKVSDASEQLTSGGGHWKLPFFLLLLVVVVMAGGAYYLYEKLRKSHFL